MGILNRWINKLDSSYSIEKVVTSHERCFNEHANMSTCHGFEGIYNEKDT